MSAICWMTLSGRVDPQTSVLSILHNFSALSVPTVCEDANVLFEFGFSVAGPSELLLSRSSISEWYPSFGEQLDSSLEESLVRLAKR